MKIQRILGILWFALFVSILIMWFWQFMEKPYEVYFRAFTSLVFLFGAVASIFLFRGARWARFSVGAIALVISGLVMVEIVKSFLSWQDGCLGCFALASVVLLFWPKHERVA